MTVMNSSKTNSIDDLVGRIADALASTTAPVVSAYELARQAFMLTPEPAAQSPKKVYEELVGALLKARLLTPMDHMTTVKAYLLFGRSSATPSEVVCSLDPFAYVSHLSAMEHHGLTDRFPKILYMTRPPAVEWRKQAAVRMEKDLDGRLLAYKETGLPRLVQPKISNVGHTVVQFYERSQLGAFRLVAGSSLRVATIGRVFLDMLREPALCGGIQHVIDIYQKEAKRYVNLITDEVDRHGQPIDKVRVGYILSEVCEIEAPVFEEWVKSAQRGGSRKLDPDGEYVSNYSARWQLSINVPSLTRLTDGANE